jgi:hypothetical protein
MSQYQVAKNKITLTVDPITPNLNITHYAHQVELGKGNTNGKMFFALPDPKTAYPCTIGSLQYKCLSFRLMLRRTDKLVNTRENMLAYPDIKFC